MSPSVQRGRMRVVRAVVLGWTAHAIAGAGFAKAQAWVPPARVGAVTVGFQWIDNTGHLLDDGTSDERLPGASLDASLYVSLEYAFTDRLSAEIGLPYVWAKYVGPELTPPPVSPLDSCYCWHGDFQDFGLVARYNAVGEPGSAFALTPSIAFGAPSHGYPYQGETVVGRRLKELALAVDAGWRVDPISPRLSVQAHYAYAWVEEVLDISTNRSNFAVQAAYQLTRQLSVQGFAWWQWTHGGLRVPQDFIDVDPEIFAEHDRLLRNDYLHAGGGVSYQLGDFDVYASYMGFVSGRNTHQGWAVSFGVSYPFELGGGAP